MKTVVTKKAPLLFFLLITAVSINAQTLQWTQTFGGTGDDGGQSMIMANDGGIVIAGFKSPAPLTYKDVLVMKIDASGNELWSRIYNLHRNDIARAIRNTSDGGYIICGMTEVTPQIFDPFLIKTDSTGTVQWQQQYDYGFGFDDRGHDVWQTSDGGYIIAGQTRLIHGSFSNYDMYIVKTDKNGNVQWIKVFFRENEGSDVALGVQQLADHGYIIGGYTHSSAWASYIIRTDSSGNAIWSNIYPGAWQSECYDIQATPDGGFILTGTESSYQTDTDVLIIKLDANGNLIWKKIYGTVDADQGNSILQLLDGGYIIAGMSVRLGYYDMYVVRTNSTGDSLWTTTIGGISDDRASSIVSPQAGTYYVAGGTLSFGQGGGDVYLAKLTESNTGIIENNSVPNSFALYQNYPNPFNPSTKIRFDLPKPSFVKVIIYDIGGREIATLINERLNSGSHEVEWDDSKHSSGVYFYKLITDGFAETKKMVLLK